MTTGTASSLSILIADDEPLARERLRRLIEALPGYRVCGEAGDGESALAQVAGLEPDILLLDIRMPGMDGIEAAEQLDKLQHPPALIFCTAYDQYAIQAFQVRAVSYLLKPVRKEALADALGRVGRTNRVQRQAVTNQPAPKDDQIAVSSYRGTELIDLHQLLYCEADMKYVTLHHTRGETVCDFTLKELETTYSRHLLRIHRHTLVGVRYIQALRRTPEGQHVVVLNDARGELPVSRRHASNLRQWLKEHQPG